LSNTLGGFRMDKFKIELGAEQVEVEVKKNLALDDLDAKAGTGIGTFLVIYNAEKLDLTWKTHMLKKAVDHATLNGCAFDGVIFGNTNARDEGKVWVQKCGYLFESKKESEV